MTIQNYKRNVLRTPANNKIRLDDERGKEHIKVSTEYGGKSQLNLGHLVDAGKQQRGEGFELRTDMWGVVRAKKGIFISADAQDNAQGQVREMAPAMAILNGAQSQMKSLSTDAQTANADPADLSSQIALLQQSVKDLNQAAILLSAGRGDRQRRATGGGKECDSQRRQQRRCRRGEKYVYRRGTGAERVCA
ncbi:hypothetical protein ECZU51_49430 [Escherichia coli]|nr:hypothetical protein ECZU51_49430 [Escherichia coli]